MLSANIRRRAVLGLLFLGISGLHFLRAWAGGPATNVGGKTSEYYTLMTDAWLAGRTSLLIEPDPRLLALPNPRDPAANAPYRLHDASLYNGKYYLYFGPAPALVLFLPYRIVTGSHLPNRLAVALFCTMGFACSCALFFLLAKREKWLFPSWFACAAVLSMGTSPLVFFLLIRPSFYEVAIAGGYGFVMAGFLFLAYALGPPLPRWGGLLLAGLCFGLAAGCRPNLSLVAVLAAVMVSFRIRRYGGRVLALAAPIVICGALLAWHNYVRFQNPLEFGMQYQLTGSQANQGAYLSFKNILPGIYYLVLSPPQAGLRYPFLVPTAGAFPLGRLPEHFGLAPVIGLLWGSPIALLGLATPWVIRKGRLREFSKPGTTRFTIYALYTAGLATLTLLLLTGWVSGRYAVDFAPALLVPAWCWLAAQWQSVRSLPGTRAWLFGAAWGGLACYSVFLDAATCLQRIPR